LSNGNKAAANQRWTKYGDILDAVDAKLKQASNTIEKARTRSRAVGSKLNAVQELPGSEALPLLPPRAPEDEDMSPHDS